MARCTSTASALSTQWMNATDPSTEAGPLTTGMQLGLRLAHLVSLLQEPSNIIPLCQTKPQVFKCRNNRLAAGARAGGARRGCIAQLRAQLLHEHARVAAQRQPANSPHTCICEAASVYECLTEGLAHKKKEHS